MRNVTIDQALGLPMPELLDAVGAEFTTVDIDDPAFHGSAIHTQSGRLIIVVPSSMAADTADRMVRFLVTQVCGIEVASSPVGLDVEFTYLDGGGNILSHTLAPAGGDR
ncbi:hypothetical protein [Streptomyces sp. Z26]|uniref:hypothetical protein n=1 Tax=Streptomyces sp. Z26 TaxID=2500177 RepID=UPI000FCB69D1|nr:hypothetical protein [Streptomyces sp. Z26]